MLTWSDAAVILALFVLSALAGAALSPGRLDPVAMAIAGAGFLLVLYLFL